MTPTLLRQTRNNNCGQTAVAMLTGKSIREIEQLYGHIGTTTLFEHTRMLNKLGYVTTGWVTRGQPDFKVPTIGLVRVGFLKRSGGRYSTSGKVKRHGHLVLLVNGTIYDPAGVSYPLDSMPAGVVITHAMAVFAP